MTRPALVLLALLTGCAAAQQPLLDPAQACLDSHAALAGAEARMDCPRSLTEQCPTGPVYTFDATVCAGVRARAETCDALYAPSPCDAFTRPVRP